MPAVLAVFAHPDDMELLCAGTLRLLVQRGWSLHVATLCGGDLGASTGTREAIRATRSREAEAGAALIGGSYACAGLDDFTVHYCPDQLRLVTDLVRRAQPDLVVTHSPDDYLLDHEECAKLVRMAVFAAGVPLWATKEPSTGKLVPALYYADALEGKEALGRPVVPSFRVDITTTFADRQRALACHASQRDWLRAHHGVDEYLTASERFASASGSACGVRYAEGFRQHLGHGYPQENALAQALSNVVITSPSPPPSWKRAG